MAGRAPDYNLCAICDERTGGKWVQVGVAWLNDNGSISIRLNALVSLTDVNLRLFATDKSVVAAMADKPKSFDVEDIPF